MVAVGAAPLPGALRQGGAGASGVDDDGAPEAEAHAGLRLEARELVAHHRLGGFGAHEGAAARANRLEELQKVARRARHSGAARRVRGPVEDAPRREVHHAAAEGGVVRVGHEHGAGTPVAVGGGEPRRVRDREAGVGQAERAGDQALDRLGQRDARGAGDDLAEHVDRERIAPRRAGLGVQGHRREPPRVLGEREAGLVEAVRHPCPAVGPAFGRVRKAVAEPGRVGQQLAYGDDRLAPAFELGAKLGQPLRYRVVEAELASVNERERGGRDERLRDRREPKDGVFAHRTARLAVGLARRPAVDDPAVARHQGHHAHHALLGEGPIDDLVEALAQGGFVAPGRGGRPGGGRGRGGRSLGRGARSRQKCRYEERREGRTEGHG
jgi:hypothetical protein